MQIDDYQIISIDIEEGKQKHDLSKSMDSLYLNHHPIKNKTQYSNKITSEYIIQDYTSSSSSIYSWNAITSSLINIKDSLKYNYFSFNNSYPIFNNNIQLFDKQFTPNQKGKLTKYLNLLFLMTYRTNFPSLLNQNNKKTYNSDCGWGCMIRCGQMMLSNAILSFKLFSIDHFYNSRNSNVAKDDTWLLIDNETINKKRIETILLFFDYPINITDICDKDEFFSYLQDETISLSNDNNGNTINNSTQVISPFSILNIFIQGRIVLNKEPGEWFSDVNLIKAFYAIQRSFRGNGPFEVFYFTEGFIDEKYLVAKCFNEKSKMISLETIKRRDKEYAFIKGGVIFVAVRLGLDAIEKEYYNSIRALFDIRNNIGIIGGKTNKAYYFVGKCKEGLLYLDPHCSQSAIVDRKSLIINTNFNTYSVKDMYVLKIENMSPCFTIGFLYRNYDEYKMLISDLTEHQKLSFPICKLNLYK